jgi:predicted nucleic acid-binding protein
MRRMNILVDANVLLRLADPTRATHGVAATAVVALRAQGNVLHIIPQCIYEFWAAATRPIANNGLGLSTAECSREVANLMGSFTFLDDKPSLFAEWQALVSVFACHGKVAHDARYVASMRTHGLTDFLTFNCGDFARFVGLNLYDPTTISASGPSSANP